VWGNRRHRAARPAAGHQIATERRTLAAMPADYW